MKQRLHDANNESSDAAARAAASCLRGGASLAMIEDDQQLRTFLSTNVDKTAGIDCTAFLRTKGAKALADMGVDERRLFEFSLAIDALGAAGGTGASLFADGSLLAAWDYLARRLDDAAAIHDANATEYGEIGAGLWITGIVLSALPGAGVSFMASAVIMFGLGVSEQTIADGYTAVASDARARVQGEGSYGAEAAASDAAFASGVDAGAAAIRDLSSAQSRLSSLKGAGWGARPSEGEFMDALAGMYAQSDGSPVPDRVASAVHEYFDSIGPGAGNAPDILSALVRVSDLEMKAAEQALLSASARAREQQDASEAGWRQALSAFQSSGSRADLAALSDTAAIAFATPSFVAEDHARWLSRVQQELGLEPGPASSTQYETARGEVLDGLKTSLLSLCEQRLQGIAEVRQAEWDLEQERLSRARSAWTGRMELLVARGNAAWEEAGKTLEQESARWRSEFEKEYTRKSREWDAVVLGFLEGKQKWAAETAGRAARTGSEQILAEVGQSADALSREATGRLVTRMLREAPVAEEILARLLPTGTLGAALEDARRHADWIDSAGMTVSRGLAGSSSPALSLAVVRGFLAEETEELSRRGALVVADSAALSLQRARDGYRNLVQDANEGFEAGMDRLFLAAGYSKSAGRYQREGIIGSTVLSGVVREHQEVAGFNPFPVPAFELGVSLGVAVLGGLSAEGIQARLSAALEELEEQQEEIFGPADEPESGRLSRSRSFDKKDYTVDDDDGFWGELWEGITSLFGEKESGTTRVEQSWGAGAFGAHIGYAPVFVGCSGSRQGLLRKHPRARQR